MAPTRASTCAPNDSALLMIAAGQNILVDFYSYTFHAERLQCPLREALIARMGRCVSVSTWRAGRGTLNLRFDNDDDMAHTRYQAAHVDRSEKWMNIVMSTWFGIVVLVICVDSSPSRLASTEITMLIGWKLMGRMMMKPTHEDCNVILGCKCIIGEGFTLTTWRWTKIGTSRVCLARRCLFAPLIDSVMLISVYITWKFSERHDLEMGTTDLSHERQSYASTTCGRVNFRCQFFRLLK